MFEFYLHDVHTHTLLLKNIKIEEVLEKIKEKNIIIVENGLNYDYNNKIIEILRENRENDFFLISLGFHPTDVAKSKTLEIEKTIKQIEENLNLAVAIGEVGLDFYWIKEENLRKKEVEIFKKILEIAEENNRVLIVHSRKAEREVFEIIKDYKVKVIMHSYTGKIKYVEKYALKNKNIYFSIPPAVNRIPNFQSLVKIIPLEKILLETDSPFMSPIKGEENLPWNVEIGLEVISRIKDKEKEEVRKILNKNFENLILSQRP